MAKKPTKQPDTTPIKQEPIKMSTFEDILNTPVNAVEKPKPRPAGTYYGIVAKSPEIKKIGKNETLAAVFEIKLVRPGDDVDQDSLQEAGGIGERPLRVTQFLTKDALWRLVDFFKALGMDTESGDSISELLPQTMGRQALFKIRHRPSQDGTELYEEFDSAAAL